MPSKLTPCLNSAYKLAQHSESSDLQRPAKSGHLSMKTGRQGLMIDLCHTVQVAFKIDEIKSIGMPLLIDWCCCSDLRTRIKLKSKVLSSAEKPTGSNFDF